MSSSYSRSSDGKPCFQLLTTSASPRINHRVESNQRDAVTGIGQQRVDSPAADRVVEEIVIVEIGEIALDDVDYGAVPRKDSAANGRAAMNPRLLDVGWVRWSKRGAFIARHRGKASAKRGLVIAES